MVENGFIVRLLSLLLAAQFTALQAQAQILSSEAEVKLVTGVGFTPQTVMLENTYTNAVPVCTYNLPSTANSPAIPRITNITATSFQVSIQSMPNTNPGNTGDVHCIIVDEGTHTLPDGRQVQAITQLVTDVLGLEAGNFEETVDISGLVSPGFANPIALGAVISSNDTRATAFHATDCEGRGNEPFLSGSADGICVGYHIGQQSDVAPPAQSYAAETVGVIIVDEGSGTVGVFDYVIARGPNTIDGVGNNGAAYAVSGDFEIGVATQAAENGGQGGWAVLLGADPLPNNQLLLGIDEEVVAGDASRSHITEIVDYWLFSFAPAPNLEVSKVVEVFDPDNDGLFALPGNDVLYTVTLTNTGNGVVDDGSLFVVDALPPEVVFFNGDADGPGPGMSAVIFDDFGSGLTFNPSSDVAYAIFPPSSFTDCTHTPAPGFDPATRYVCFNPKGEMAPGDSALSSFTLTFRARLQ